MSERDRDRRDRAAERQQEPKPITNTDLKAMRELRILDEALALPAGRELDAIVAVRCRGWRWVRYDWSQHWVLTHPGATFGHKTVRLEREPCEKFDDGYVPSYSTQLTVAFELVQAAIDAGLAPWMVRDGYEGNWDVSMDAAGEWAASAPTLPLAICRAALRWKWRDET